MTCPQNRELDRYVVELFVLLHLGTMSNLESDISLDHPSLNVEGVRAIAGFEKQQYESCPSQTDHSEVEL